MQKNFQKFISIILLISFVAFLLPFQHVKAVVPVLDPAHTAKTTAGWLQQVARWIKEDSLKMARDVIAKKIIDMIVAQTINWIQGGGKPLFVSNWKAFLKQAGDVAFDSIIKDIGLAGLCAPFKFSMKFALLPVKKFPVRVECTLDKVVKNISGFYNDFKQGNWAAFSASSQPQNNFYGQLVIANDELTARIASEKDAASKEAAAGSGFLSVKKCVQYDQKYIDSCSRGGEETAADCKGHASACLKYETMTPGDAVGKSVASAITSDKEWASNIQSWSAALVNAAINRVVQQGLAKMTGAGDDSYHPPEYESLIYAELNQQKQFYVDDMNKFINDWSAIKSLKQQTINYANQSINVIQTILATNCLSSSETTDYTKALNQYKGDIDFSMGRLPIEIGVLESKIDEAGQVKNFILGATDTSEDQIKIQQVYNAFSSKFNEDRTARDSSSARDAANSETTNFKTALDNQNAKIIQCQSSL